MAALVTDYMEAYGTKFAWKCIPKRVEKLPSGALQVTWTDVQTSKEHQDTYDCVLWAVGEAVCCHVHGNVVYELTFHTNKLDAPVRELQDLNLALVWRRFPHLH